MFLISQECMTASTAQKSGSFSPLEKQDTCKAFNIPEPECYSSINLSFSKGNECFSQVSSVVLSQGIPPDQSEWAWKLSYFDTEKSQKAKMSST